MLREDQRRVERRIFFDLFTSLNLLLLRHLRSNDKLIEVIYTFYFAMLSILSITRVESLKIPSYHQYI
jgi:hypothetical protein